MGIVFAYTDDSLIENVATVNNEWAGVWLFSCSGSTVSASRVSDNGEGIYVEDCQGTLLDGNLITFNQRGIYTSVSDIEIANCFVSGNSPNGGVCIESGTQARILNCTISGNGGTENMYPEPSGIYCGSSSQVTLGNSIVWANYPTQFSGSDTITARYCDIQGGYDGQGNIDAPPLLTPDGHIRLGSPCIRAGAALAGMFSHYDIDGELRSGRGGVDIGLDQYNDADSDGLPDWWETEYFNDKRIASPDWDTDGDAHTNLTEYEAYSSDPTIPAASFYVSADRPDDSGDGSSWETAKRSIQAAIDLSGNSDAVYVGPGLYEENVTTAGRLIMLAGIDAQDPDVVAGTVIAGTVAIDRGETPGCVLSGLTITNRSSTGLLCSGSSPTIANCSIINCFCMDYQQAGGIMLLNASPKITECVISGNIAPSTGGGLLCRSSSPVLRQCVITGNLAQYGSGGEATAIYAEQSHVTLDNCTIAYNANAYQSPTSGSTIACTAGDVTITNSILWNSQSVQVRSNESTVKVTYSDIQGGTQTLQGLTSSVGNIAVDPCFVSPGSWDSNPAYSLPSRWITGDYHLQSTGWRWTPIMTHGTHWVWDSRTSRCIDAGNPADPLGAEPVTVPNDPAGEWGRNARINMGAYGGTREASMAPCDWALRSDINNDGIVSLPDLPYVGQALRSRAARLPADLTRDSRVDYADLALMADEWLRTTDWCRIKPGRFR